LDSLNEQAMKILDYSKGGLYRSWECRIKISNNA
jgi:hypothetical protein